MSAKDDHSLLSEMAKRLFKDDDADGQRDYVDWHMRRLGYNARTEWEDATDTGGDSDNPFSSRRRQTRHVPGRQSGGGNSDSGNSGGDWMYGSGR